MGMTCIVEIIFFSPLVFFVPFPPLEIWYFIIASVILHGFYRLSVIYSYKFGDLSFVYPIARGGSSLLIVILTLIILQEHISLLGFVGILTVCIGIFLISYSKNHKINFNAFILAVSTALLITHTRNTILHICSHPLQLPKVLHVPTIAQNLLSVSSLCKTNPISIEFFSDYFLVKDQKTRVPLLK